MFISLLLLVSPLGAQYMQVRIRDIQYTTDPSGNSPLNGQRVTFTGIVTAPPSAWRVSIVGFFVQDTPGPWSGIYIYTGNFSGTLPPLDEGDSVQIWGRVYEYNGMTEISPLDSVKILKKRVRMMPAQRVRAAHLCTGCDSSEAYEGVLVQVENAVVVNNNLGFGEWMISDGGPADTVRVDDAARYTYTPANGDSLTAVRGVLYFSFGTSKIEPRGNQDLFFRDAAGSGLWWVNPTVGFARDTTSLRIFLVGSIPDTLHGFRVFFPSGGNLLSATPGGGFAGATVNVSTTFLDVSGFSLLQGDTGWVDVRWVVPPVGTYLLTAQTSENGAPKNLVPLGFESVSLSGYLAGAGTAWLAPREGFAGTPTDLEVTYALNLPLEPPQGVAWIRVEVVGDHVWNGNVQTGGAFTGAQVNVTRTDSSVRIDLTGLNIQSGDTGRMLLLGYTPQGLPGSRRVYVASGLDSLAPLSGSPLLWVIRPDTSGVLPLSVFHDPALEPQLQGLSVRVQGTVTAVMRNKVFLQDATGGIVLYRPQGTFQVGDSVEVRGVYNPYYGLAELTSASLVTVLAQGRSVAPETLDFASIGEGVEGRLVYIPRVHIVGSRTSFVSEGGRYDTTTNAVVVQDVSGVRRWIYADAGSGLAGVVLPPDTFHLMGVVQQDSREGVFQYVISPRSVEDILPIGKGAGTFTLSWPFFTGDTLDSVWLVMDAPVPIGQAVIAYPADSLHITRVTSSKPLTMDTVAGEIRLSFSPQASRDSLLLEGVFLRASQVVLSAATSPEPASTPAPVLRSPVMIRTEPLASIQRPGPDGNASARVGDTVVVGGVVTAPSRAFSPTGLTSFYIQDRTGGVNVFGGFPLPSVDTGELVFLRGVVKEYQGLTEVVLLSDTAFHRMGRAPVPAPRVIGRDQGLNEALEGLLVRVDSGVVAQKPYLSGSGFTLLLWNGRALVTVYAYSATGLDSLMMGLEKGQVVSVTGVVGQYQSTHQLLPRSPRDVVVHTVSEAPQVRLSLSPNVVLFSRGECLNLSVSGPAAVEFTVEVYDLSGRLRAVPLLRRPGPYTFCWDGRGRDGRQLRGGLHLAKLIARHPDGRLEEQIQPFVVGVK